jgi:bile acid:Na+ symporter, BASS family
MPDFLHRIFSPLVLIFTVTNLAAMGLQVRMPEVRGALHQGRAVVLIFAWGWILGPALGYTITRILPLAEPFSTVVLLASLAPCAPFLPLMIGKSGGDMGFAGAFIPLVTLGTVILMPLMAPLLIPGLAISAKSLARPLILTILLPLLVGAAVRHFAGKAADRLIRPVGILAKLSTLLTVACCLILYGRGMLDTAGSFALLSVVLFTVIMGGITWRFGFGLSMARRRVMSLGMGTRNIAAVFAAALAIPDADPRILVMIVLWTIASAILAALAARFFSKLAGPPLHSLKAIQ